jgi:RNA polymerase sigma-70 factor (ECF subfamily)
MEKVLHKVLNASDSNVIATVYTDCHDDLLRYITAYTHDVMTAEDMAQDVFMKVMDLDVLTQETARSLVFTIAKRMIIDDARHKAFVRQQEKKLRETQPLYDSFSVAQKIAHDELASMEQHILDRMAPKRAEVYKMYRHEELTSQEIADKLSLSKRTVETHIYLSTKQMREEMRKAL